MIQYYSFDDIVLSTIVPLYSSNFILPVFSAPFWTIIFSMGPFTCIVTCIFCVLHCVAHISCHLTPLSFLHHFLFPDPAILFFISVSLCLDLGLVLPQYLL